MQERSLSTRMLHFCARKLYYECRSCRKSEEGEPFNQLRAYDLWPRNEEWMDPGPTTEARSLMKRRLYERWRQTVGVYSKWRLTKDFDRLPAIQSIASEMAPFIHDKYIARAGMWNGIPRRSCFGRFAMVRFRTRRSHGRRVGRGHPSMQEWTGMTEE